MSNDEMMPPQEPLIGPGQEILGPVESQDIVTHGIYPEISPLNNWERPLLIEGGRLLIDENRYLDEQARVRDSLIQAIQDGDRDVFDRLTDGVGNMRQLDEEESVQLSSDLEQAFINRDVSSLRLNQLNVDLVVNGIAERNVIRQGLSADIPRQPFSFLDREGQPFKQDDLDYVFVKDKSGDSFKVIVSAKKGIDGVNLPSELDPSKFNPDLSGVSKDPITGVLSFTLKKSADGVDPIVVKVEVHMGPTDIYDILGKEEKKEANRARRERKQSQPAQQASSQYSPPPPSTPRRSSESGGYGTVSYSR